MVSAASLLALAACVLPFAFASPPAPSTCCTDGQGEINQPGQGSFFVPGQGIPFDYTPRNGKTWTSHNITVSLVIAEKPKSAMTANAITNQVLAKKADYTWGTYKTQPGAKALPKSLILPDVGFAPWNWGGVSDLQMYITVLERWTQSGSPNVYHKDVTYHWFTYRSNSGYQFQCSGTVERADQTPCECQFCSYPGMGMADNSTKLFSQVRLDEYSCRELCDLTVDCYTYTWNQEGTVMGGNPDDSCVLYSAIHDGAVDVASPGMRLGQADTACKAGCYQATFTG